MIPMPVSLPDSALPCYATVTEAAQEAIGAAWRLTGDTAEAGGALYRHGPPPGSGARDQRGAETLYCFTVPVTQHDMLGVDYRIALPAGDRLVALYHTHPGFTYTATQVSPSDKKLAQRLGVTMYVGAVRARAVIEYSPLR